MICLVLERMHYMVCQGFDNQVIEQKQAEINKNNINFQINPGN